MKCQSKELVSDEMKLKSQMDPVVGNAVRQKRLNLFSEMIEFYKYPDKDMVNEFISGADSVGEVPTTNMLPVKLTPDGGSTQGSQSKLRRPHVDQDFCSSGNGKLMLKSGGKQTLEERDKGWLLGPIPLKQIPPDAPMSRRFGLRQRYKVRLTDDFSESSVNQAVTVFEAPLLHTVDIAAATLVFWLRGCKKLERAAALMVRTFDLSSAYRQVGLSPAGRAFSLLSCHWYLCFLPSPGASFWSSQEFSFFLACCQSNLVDWNSSLSSCMVIVLR